MLGASSAFAEPAPLTNDDLKQAVAGSVVEIDTPLGTTVPMRFTSDGLVSAEAGALAPVLGAAKDRGRWWVDGEKLCTKWFRWFDAQPRCLTISRDGSKIFWRKIDDGETGTGTLITATQPKDKSPTKPAETVVAAQTPPSVAPAAVAKAPEQPSTPADAQPKKTTFASRLAGPEREVGEDKPDRRPAKQTTPTATVPVDTTASPATADAEKSDETAPVVTASVSPPVAEGPTMRFGGAGLLEASSRIDSAAPAGDAASTPPEAITENYTAAAAPEPAKTEHMATAAIVPQKPVKTLPQPTRSAALQKSAPVAKRDGAQRGPARAARDVVVATSSSRTIALYRVRGVASYDVLNIRRGPSEEHVPIAAIPPTGRDVQIVGDCRADWCPIRYRGVSGWVNSYYLAEDGARDVADDDRRIGRP